MQLAEIATAHEFATKQVAGGDFTEPDLKDALGCVEDGVFTLLNNVVTDTNKSVARRHVAAMAQYLYSGRENEEMIELVTTDTLLRSLLQEGLVKEDRSEWDACHDVVYQDVMLELARLLD